MKEDKIITKEEVYQLVVDVQKKMGQGLSGIVKVLGGEKFSDLHTQYLDELIEEGLVKACDTGGSLGHPESNIFYVPTKGYNVWEDDGTDGKFSRHKGRYLTNVRFYLGILKEEPEEDRTELYNAIHPSYKVLAKNLEFMEEYAKWLKRNEKELEEMVNLEEDYYKVSKAKRPKPGKMPFTAHEIKWIKGRSWYTENQTVKKCLVESENGLKEDEKSIDICDQIIKLAKRGIEINTDETKKKEYRNKIAESEQEKEEIIECKPIRRKLNEWLKYQTPSVKIKTLIK